MESKTQTFLKDKEADQITL